MPHDRLNHLAFGALILTAAWAILFVGFSEKILTGPGFGGFSSDGPSGAIIVAVPKTLSNTVAIMGLNLNDPIGSEISVLTERHLSALGPGTASTTDGSTRFSQSMRLAQIGTDAFTSGAIQYTKNDDGDVGDFLVFTHGKPVFEYELLFESGLPSRIEAGRLTSLESTSFRFMGAPATIYKATVQGNAIEVRMFTSGGDVTIRDSDATDSAYERGARVGGQTINAQTRIRASIDTSSVRILSIDYRLIAYSRTGGDTFLSPRHGIRQYLREPQGMINPSFDIVYAGMAGGALAAGAAVTGAAVSGTDAPAGDFADRITGDAVRSASGASIFFDPSGGDRYNLIFTNLAGRTIKMPFVALSGGAPVLGNANQRLIAGEASSPSGFNINVNDYFVATSSNDINGVTNIALYSGSSPENRELYFDLLGGGRSTVVYDGTTGKGTLNVMGSTHTVYYDLSGGTERIAVDQNHDGTINGATARIVTLGGAQIEPGATSTTIRIARRLFDNPPTNDETVTITFAADGSRINLGLASQSSLTLSQSSDRLVRGMTQYGVQYTYDDRHVPSTLSIDVPSGRQRAASAAVTSGRVRPSTGFQPANIGPTIGSSSIGQISKGGQSGGIVVFTMERERFLPKGAVPARQTTAGQSQVGVFD